MSNEIIYAVIIGIFTVFGSIGGSIIVSRAAVESAKNQPDTKNPLDQSQTIETQVRTIQRLSSQVETLQKDFDQIKKGRLVGNFIIETSNPQSATIRVQYQDAE